ncbi:MAG: hypothetical protein JW741_17420 [Sedimentisphaerales bacterium]|nr:hypothetical protein [Sedimentisphaerales bacterium]
MTDNALSRIGYRLLYDSKGCSISGRDELAISFLVSEKYDVEVYFGPQPRHGLSIVSNSAKYYVPGTNAFLGTTQFLTDTNGSSGYGPFFLEIVVSVHAESDLSAGNDARSLLLKQAETRRDEFKAVINLVAGLIGLRFHRQFVLEPFNENVLAWDNGIPVRRYAGPVLENLELIPLNDNGINHLEAWRKPLASLSADALKNFSLVFHWLLRAWNERDDLQAFIALFIPLEAVLTGVTETKMNQEDKRRAKSIRVLLKKHGGQQSKELISFIDRLVTRTGPTLDERFEDVATAAKLPGWEADIKAFGKFKRMRNTLLHGSDTDVHDKLSVGEGEVRTLQDLVERYVNYVLFKDNNVYRSRWRPERSKRANSKDD